MLPVISVRSTKFLAQFKFQISLQMLFRKIHEKKNDHKNWMYYTYIYICMYILFIDSTQLNKYILENRKLRAQATIWLLRERAAVRRVVVVDVFVVVDVVEARTVMRYVCVTLLSEVKQQIAAEFNVRLNGDLVRAAQHSQCGEFLPACMPVWWIERQPAREQESAIGEFLLFLIYKQPALR